MLMERQLLKHFRGVHPGALFAVGLAVLVGCGGHTQTHTNAPVAAAPGAAAPAKGKPAAAAPAPQKPQSPGLRDFDAGLRAIKLGGPAAYERAADSFQRAVTADNSLWEAWYTVGVARWHLGDDRGAVTAQSKALEDNGDYKPA